MKIRLISIALFLSGNFLFSQESNTPATSKMLGIHFSSLGHNQVYQFQSLEGAPDYESDGFLVLGLNYMHYFNDGLALETGLEYGSYRLTPDHGLPSGMATPGKALDISLMALPLVVRAHFWKYFFLNAGVLFHADVSNHNDIDAQNGIGGMAGLGLHCNFSSGVFLFANPYFNTYSLLSFSGINNAQRLLETGFRFGISYELNRNQQIE